MIDHQRIRDALGLAKLRHCWPIVLAKLDENQKAGKHPSEVGHLAELLNREMRNVRKMMVEERYLPRDEHILGLAICLKVPVQDLLPTSEDWIARAVCILCGPSVTLPDARSFARYRLASNARNSGITEEVRRVAQLLDEVLSQIPGRRTS